MTHAVRQPDMKLGSVSRTIALAALAACITDEASTQAFDDDDNDDTLVADGKADSTAASGYRNGCGAPIRTGSYALHGDVVTPTGIMASYYVTVTDEKISHITAAKPSGMTVIETNGIIFPGLIDGHGHVEYNHIPIADLGKRYQDRDQWPGAALYQTLVKDPKNAVTKAGLQCEAVKHGEIRGLVGGTTGIQGTPAIACARSLVRNIELTNFCQDHVRQNVMDISGFGRSISGKPSFADSIKSDIAAHRLDAFAVHAGEGIDQHELDEWAQLKSFGLNVPQLVMIHTAAFGDNEYKEIGAVGAKVVWSPSSNLILYGKTANIPLALQYNVNVSLGSDWAPSGSPNLLAELKVADRVNQKLWQGVITDQQLVNMVTINPAKAFALDKFIGSIEDGKYADLLVIAKPTDGSSDYRALINAQPQDVQLVTISGDPLFGRTDIMDALGKTGDYEVIDDCGTPRGIDVTVTASDVTKGTEKLSDIESQLGAVNPKLTPVIECTNPAAAAAYNGIPELQ
jgi:cytosine/adenosine deaminase-related metal-dependent hydrolase